MRFAQSIFIIAILLFFAFLFLGCSTTREYTTNEMERMHIDIPEVTKDVDTRYNGNIWYGEDGDFIVKFYIPEQSVAETLSVTTDSLTGRPVPTIRFKPRLPKAGDPAKAQVTKKASSVDSTYNKKNVKVTEGTSFFDMLKYGAVAIVILLIVSAIAVAIIRKRA